MIYINGRWAGVDSLIWSEPPPGYRDDHSVDKKARAYFDGVILPGNDVFSSPVKLKVWERPDEVSDRQQLNMVPCSVTDNQHDLQDLTFLLKELLVFKLGWSFGIDVLRYPWFII